MAGIEFEQKRKIDELEKQVKELESDVEYWKQKANEMFWEYQLLCDKIIQMGVFFKPKEEDGGTTD